MPPTIIPGSCQLTYPVRQITINDLPVGRSVDETLRLLKAFQHAVRHQPLRCRTFDTGSIPLGQAWRGLPTRLDRR